MAKTRTEFVGKKVVPSLSIRINRRSLLHICIKDLPQEVMYKMLGLSTTRKRLNLKPGRKSEFPNCSERSKREKKEAARHKKLFLP